MKFKVAALALAATILTVSSHAQPSSNSVTNAPHPIANYAPVTEDVLRSPAATDWIMMRGNYQGWGYSTLDEITKSNVKNLQLVWARGMEPGINEGTPIVHNGVMFLPNPMDVIQAVDAATGELLWQYHRNLPSREAMHNNPWGQRKRSIFLYQDRLYTVTWDNFLVALDAKTGKQLWEVNRGGEYYATNTTGPIVVDGVVIAGSNCQEAPFGCFVTGNDAETGKELWRNSVIPKKGEPGDETWGGKPESERWITGVWGPITYDPDQDLAFYGSSGIGPGSEAQRNQIGMSLAGTNTRFAIDPKTGKVRWQHQVLPEDNWDQECTFEMMPITTAVHPDRRAEGMMAIGTNLPTTKTKTLSGAPCKTGILWSFEERDGKFLWAKSTAEQNLISGIDPKGLVSVNNDALIRDLNKVYHHCPPHDGGRNWPFSAYNPKSNLLFVQIQNLCVNTKVRSDNIPSAPHDTYNTIGPSILADGKRNMGRIDAISLETGKTAWTWETPASNYSPILTTASGLLFNGGMDRYLRSFDSDNGKVLWQTRLGSQVFGAPVTYSVEGRQYIAVTAGGGFNGTSVRVFPGIDQASGSNMVYVFALPK